MVFPVNSQVNKFEHLYRHSVDFSLYSRHGIKQTNNKDYIFIRGVIDTLGGNNINKLDVIKTNKEGDLIWASSIDRGLLPVYYTTASLMVSPDNNIYIVSSYSSSGSDVKGALIKLNINGQFVWAKNYSFLQNIDLNDIKYVNPDRFLITGNCKSSNGTEHGFVMMTDSLGTPIWNKKVDCTGDTTSKIYSAKLITDQEFIVCGSSNNKAYAMKMSFAGDVIWSKGYSNVNSACFEDCEKLDDGNLVFAGEISQDGSSENIFFIKTDTSGAKLWSKTTPFSSANFTGGFAHSICDFSGNTLLFSAYAALPIPTGIVGKLDYNGNIIWAKGYTSNFHNFNYLPSTIIPTLDGGMAYYISDVGTTTNGSATHSSALLKMDNSGNIGCNGNAINFQIIDYSPLVNNLYGISDIVFTNANYSPSVAAVNINDTMICETITDSNSVYLKENSSLTSHTIYPNPSRGKATLKFMDNKTLDGATFELYEASGNLIYSKQLKFELSENQLFSLDLNVKAGLYLYSIKNKHSMVNGKLIIEANND